MPRSAKDRSRREFLLLAVAMAFTLSGSSCTDASKPQAAAGLRDQHACRADPPNTELGLQKAVRCLLARTPRPLPELAQSTELYLDISASMAGFLDPQYSIASHDFRRVLDTVVLQLAPMKVTGYGIALRPIDASLGNLGRPSLYSDRDTRMELAIAKIGLDTNARTTHLLLGDARRGSPEAARTQFDALGHQAQKWVERGGTFMIGVSMAPFTTIPSDPSGCRKLTAWPVGKHDDAGDKEREHEVALADSAQAPQRCPLYLFAFVRPGDRDRVGHLIAAAFEHTFVWPLPSDLPLQLETLKPLSHTSDPRQRAQFMPRWVDLSDGSEVIRLRSDNPMSDFQTFRFSVAGTTQNEIAWREALLGQASFSVVANEAPLGLVRAGQASVIRWQPVVTQSPLIRLDTTSSPTIGVRSTGAAASPTLIRLAMLEAPVPVWLGAFEARDVDDPVRTVALHVLFDALKAVDAAKAPFAYVVVN